MTDTTTTDPTPTEGAGHKRTWIVGATIGVAVVAVVAFGLAVVLSRDGGGPDLDPVREATTAFHDVSAAEAGGYAPLLECFDDPAGGMGQHYVNQALLEDPAVDPLAPEAMVYEVADGGLELVAVEYIRPQAAGGPPELFGHTFHANDELGLWVLHAWIWRDNPAGVFEDWNPDVAACP